MPGFEYDGTITLSLSVANLDASIAWCRDLLGFEEIFKVAEAGWAEVSTSVDGVSIGLNQNGEGGEAPTVGGTTPVLGVVDIAAARAELEAKGVRFEGDTEELPGMVKLATFYDPDGNRYMLAQSLAAG